MSNPFGPDLSATGEHAREQPEAGPSRLAQAPSDTSLAAPAASQATDTFLRRLAGQSVNKAGLNKDQANVNRTIYEASKGTKFYQREHEKDIELGKKLDRLLKRRDELLPSADIPALEAECDEIIAKLELHRDLKRTLVHIDADAFYANCEELADPTLKGIAFGVGGGVLTTASYEARKFGVRSGMAGFVAKKLCPHLKFVSANFSSYSDYSRKIMSILARFDPGIAKVGMDEAFLDLTDHLLEQYPPEADGERFISVEEWGERREAVVRKIRETVKTETGLTVSAGIGPTKMLAKIGSDINKPDGQFMVPFTRDAVLDFTRPLPIRKVPGIGKVSERCLEALGVMTCGDIITHRATLNLLRYGVKDLLRAATGTTSNVREAGKREDRKSIGVERTFGDKWKREDLVEMLDKISTNLAEDMEQLGFAARCLSLKFKTHDYHLYTRDRTTNVGEYKSKESLMQVALQLLDENMPMRVRLIGLRVTHLKDLRAPKPKGALDSFITRSPTKGKQRASFADGEVISLLDSDDDDSDDGINFLPSPTKEIESPKRSPGVEQEQRGESKAQSDDDEMAVVCPICETSLPASDLALVNDHIDLCINQEAINHASRSSSPPARTARMPAAAPTRPPGVGPVKAGDGRPRKKVRAAPPPAVAPPPRRVRGIPGKTSNASGKKTNPFDMMMKR